ncbi:cytochrome b-c1 complex subunit Rieske-4 [Cucumis melo var. makuwa]|uniref:Cytochrome b-c1 complex subunit Rieske-4 n=1 Tax=Cucumis melo var. makuwa TaxID=1194695 RepID=A0A5A7VK27_CUCMM|nr:cytochrome b-c1 complex subunit Rieske-4 [Cucumis melo var. makuwa]
MTVTRVGCQKFAGGVTGGGGRRLAGDNHRVVSESWSTNFPTLETNTFRVKEWPTIASSLPGSHNILDSADSNDFRSAGFFNTFPIRPHFDRNSRERKISIWLALAVAALSTFIFVDLLFDLF